VDPSIRLTSQSIALVDDELLEQLDDEAEAEAALFAPMGFEQPPDGAEDDRPFELEVARPYAVDLAKLFLLAGKPTPPVVGADAGTHRALLLSHALTAFAPAGHRPTSIWGMGYEVSLHGLEDAVTLSLSPDDQFESIGSAKVDVNVGLTAGGKLSLMAPALVGSALGLNLPGVDLIASTDDNFSLGFNIGLRLVAVQAGPVGAGGARWNLYRHGRDLRGSQALLQTVLIPAGVSELDVELKTWVRHRRLFSGRRQSQEYLFPVERYRLTLA